MTSSPADGRPVFLKPDAGPARESGPARWVVAPLRRRAVASVIDGLLASSIGFVVCIPTWQLHEGAGPFSGQAGWTATLTDRSSTADLLISALELAVITAVWLVYMGWSATREAPFRGQTFGKQWLGIRTLAADGTPLGGRAAWRRAACFTLALSLPSAVGPLLDLAFGSSPKLSIGATVLAYPLIAALTIAALRSPLRRAWHDRFAGTVVVRAEPVGMPAGDHRDDLSMEPRRATAGTWLLLALSFAALALSAATTLYPDTFA